jgi:hypothetical protein
MQASCNDGNGGKGGSNPFAMCPESYAACGGDPSGAWKVESACGESNPAETLDVVSPKSTSCADTVKSGTIGISGTITYGAGTVTYDLTRTWSGTLVYSQACLLDYFQGIPDDGRPHNCSTLGDLPVTHTDFTCAMSGESCVCSYSGTATEQSSLSYLVSGSTISEDGPTSRSYDFCRIGTALSLHGPLDVSRVRGVIQLGRQ